MLYKEKTEREKQNNTLHFKSLTSKNGITLVTLIITIVLMLILVGVVIGVGFGEGGLLGGTSEAKYKTELKQAIEQYEYFVHKKEREDVQFEISSLMIGKNGIAYNTKILGQSGNIYTVLSGIPNEYVDCLEVIKGELYYSNDNAKKEKWARDLGLKINPYKIVDGILLSANENLALADQDTSTLVIPNSVTSIGEGAFADIKGLKTIIIPSNVKEIQKNAFNGNTTLENVIFETEMVDGVETGVTTIGEKAFYGCTALKSIKIPDTVVSMNSQVFTYCTKLEEAFFSKFIKEIPSQCFYGCTELKEFEIPEGVIDIKTYAFTNCKSLKIIRIPSTVETIRSTYFY